MATESNVTATNATDPDVTAANVAAVAVNTIDWLAAGDTTIVVPVYQRQYRWDIGGCEQLLADIRTVADSDAAHTHFIGSILSSASRGAEPQTTADDPTTADARGLPGDPVSELVLIDGQQRITTLMLLIAALHHTVRESDPVLAAELARVLTTSSGRTKLRPHRAWADVFRDVVLDERSSDPTARDSRFDDNYAFFRSQVRPEEVPRIWRGLQKIEHVAITLGGAANAQQIFESLNSTGEPLRDHELIHNYVLMGLSHDEQTEIEDRYWVPIEQNTGESIGHFWRHYLVLSTGREVATAGEHGVYGAFRHEFPRLEMPTLRDSAERWREYSEIYRVLLDPSEAQDAEIGRHLAYLNTFGRGMYPLIMRAYRDHLHGELDRAALLETFEHVQSLLLRRAVVGVPTDRLVARLCRARAAGHDRLVHAIARITPSDERVRVALKYSDLPHAAYVLGRLAGLSGLDGFEIDYIVPLAPADSWSGDGEREWTALSEDEQNSHRALAQTLGNLALIEEPLALAAFDAPFTVKRGVYARSGISSTRALAAADRWNTAAISARSAALTDAFLAVWQRPATVAIDDDGLTPILDAVKRRGWPQGWEREFEYTEYRGEHWEVHDVKYLFNRVFKRLWADAREAVVAYSARRGGPIYPERSWNGQWDTLDEGIHLYMGWDAKYMLTAVQGVLDEAGIAPEVFVKYSWRAAAM